MSIDVQVTSGGTITNGSLVADPTTVAKCVLCGKQAEATASIGAAGGACAPCLRERLDALSVARFRMHESGPRSTPWGKVTG